MENSLSIYLHEIGKYPLLNAEQEKELGRRIKEEGDESARQTMINSNLRLVVKVAKQYKNGNHGVSFEDLIMEGTGGLITAVEKYDYTRGFRFSTCAVPWIKQAITKGIADKSRIVRVPAHIIQKFSKYSKAVDELTAQFDREPTSAEVAKYMGVDEEEIHDLDMWKQNSASLSTPIGDEDGGTLEDLCDDKFDESPTDYVSKNEKSAFVKKLLSELPERTRQIFKLRFGLGDENDPEEYQSEHTLEEIGDLLNPKITRERVRQIVTNQLEKSHLIYGDNFNI